MSPNQPHVKGHHHKIPRNHCFGCGPENEHGMRLKFVHDAERGAMVAHIRLDERFTGPPGHAHGGIIATILDEAMGKVMKTYNVIALTSRMEVRYLKPVPLNQTLIAEGKPRSHRGRRYWNVGEIRNREAGGCERPSICIISGAAGRVHRGGYVLGALVRGSRNRKRA